MSGSNIPEGPDWWQASDGKWYPPELATNPSQPAPAQAGTQSAPQAPSTSSQVGPPGQTPAASVGAGSGNHPQVNPSFFSRLFDVSISEFITPSIIRVLFILGIIGSSLTGLAVLIAGLNDSSGAGAIVGIVLGPAVALLGVVYVRVLLELVMVIFRIEVNTRSGNMASPAPVNTAAESSPAVQYSAMSPEQSRVLGVLATAGGVLLLISPWMPWIGLDRQISINGWDLNYNGPLVVALTGAVSIAAGVAVLSAVGKLKASVATGAISATMLSGLVALAAVFATYGEMGVGDDDYLTTHIGMVLPGLIGVGFIINGIVRLVALNKTSLSQH